MTQKREAIHPRLNISTNVQFKNAASDVVTGTNPRPGVLLPLQEVNPKRVAKVLSRFSALANVMLGAVLDTAESAMVDAESALRQDGLLKGAAKHRMKIARQKYNRLKSVFYENVRGREELYIDLLDTFADDVNSDIEKLYWPLLHILNRHNIKNAPTKARADVAWLAFHIAEKVYSGIVEASTQLSGVKTKDFFCLVNPTDTFQAWDCLCKIIDTDYTDEIYKELSDDRNINLGFEVLVSKLLDYDEVERRCQYILDSHPEISEEAEAARNELFEERLEHGTETVIAKSYKGAATRRFKIRTR